MRWVVVIRGIGILSGFELPFPLLGHLYTAHASPLARGAKGEAELDSVRVEYTQYLDSRGQEVI